VKWHWRARVYVDGGLRVRTRLGREVSVLLPELAGLVDALDGRSASLDGELVGRQGVAARTLDQPLSDIVVFGLLSEPGVPSEPLLESHLLPTRQRRYGSLGVRGGQCEGSRVSQP
jgi:hypothetical protein